MNRDPDATLYPFAFLTALALALHGWKKGSLSPSGAIAALVVGYGHLANPLKVFGVALIFFYFAGSRATKVKLDIKAGLEDGVDPTKPTGNRSGLQVLSNCLLSLLAAVAIRLTVPNLTAHLLTHSPLSNTLVKRLVYVSLGQLSANFADTLASELGILSPSPPVYILTLKAVPPGTNGAVSLLGLGASAVGGLAVGAVFVVCLLVENQASRGEWTWAGELLLFATLSGLVGSLLDTLLGATVQRTLYSTKDKRILTEASRRCAKEAGLARIGFGRDILSNSGVNFVSGAMMGYVGWWWAGR